MTNLELELYGKYTDLKIFTTEDQIVEGEAISQLQNLINQPFMEDSKVRIMPDYHAGKGCVIGTTIQLKDKVVPNLVGVDVGCGVLTVELGKVDIDFEKLDRVIYGEVPSGRTIHENKTPGSIIMSAANFNKNNFAAQGLDNDRTAKSLGTLGGGNHFIEVAEDSNGTRFLLIHTGSRYVGKTIAEYHQKKAINNFNSNKQLIEETIKKLKASGNHKQIESEIAKIKQNTPKVQKDLAYLEGEDMADYINDMRIAQEFAYWNRLIIARTIAKHMNWSIVGYFDTVHNYINMSDMILRKGAVSARKDELLVIPINMADGTLICKGKGNSDWNNSAPHGAGRVYSRTRAKAELSLDEFNDKMKDIFSTTVTKETLDEAPMAYKSIDYIKDAIGDTVEILDVLKPLYNFKAVE